MFNANSSIQNKLNLTEEKSGCQLKLPYTAHLRVKTDLQALAQVLSWFNQFNQAPLSYPIWLSCQIALAEAFINAVRHAHAHKPADTPIDLEVQIDAQQIELKIWDEGTGFDLNQRLHTAVPVAPEAEQGRGLSIMQQVADFLSYDRVKSRNCLTLVKLFSH